MNPNRLCFNCHWFNSLSPNSCRHQYGGLFALLFWLLQMNTLSAATFNAEEFVNFEDSPLESGLNNELMEKEDETSNSLEPDTPVTLSSSQNSEKEKTNTTAARTNTPSFSQASPPPLPQTTDIIKLGYQKLSPLIESDSLDDTIFIIKEYNTKLNEFNQSAKQKLAPAIEEIFLLQGLLPASEQAIYFTTPQSSAFIGQGHNETLSDPALAALNADVAIEKPTGFIGFLVGLPRYLLNFKNILILLSCIFLLSALLKILHFVLNRIY